jgi:glycolate oxidase iron-sulfur subunit
LAKKRPGSGPDPELAAIFSKCLLCGACKKVCPRGIDIPALIMEARGTMPQVTGFASFKKFLAQQALARPALLSTLATIARPLGFIPELPEESGLTLTLSESTFDLTPEAAGLTLPEGDPQPLPSQSALYFSGCLSHYLAPAIGLAAEALLARLCGFRLLVPEQQGCCGLAARSAGDAEQAKDLARRTIARFSSDQVRELPVFTTCASCYAGLKGYPELLADDPAWRDQAQAFSQRVWEFATFILHHRLSAGPDFRTDLASRAIVYHDPCHLRFAGITKPPRTLIMQTPGLQLLELPHGPQCCGQGGLFHIAHADLAGTIRQRLVQDFLRTNAELVVTTCSGCLVQWHQGLAAAGAKAQATHLAILLAGQLAMRQ